LVVFIRLSLLGSGAVLFYALSTNYLYISVELALLVPATFAVEVE